MSGEKKPSVLMVVLVSCVVAMTLVDVVAFWFVSSKHRGMLRLKHEVISGAKGKKNFLGKWGVRAVEERQRS